MEIFLKELRFPSTKHTDLLDITGEVKAAVEKARVKHGFALVNTKHTTMGVVVQEIVEPNLIEDILAHTKQLVYEDKRSTWVVEGYNHPIGHYKHRCQDNPLKDPDEKDDDYNAGRHLRAMIYSHPSIVVAIRDGRLELGKYQQIALFEFDGRDGTGENPLRERIAQIWICPASKITEL